MPDLINVCRICSKQFMLRDDFLKHLSTKHGVIKEKHGEISDEYWG